MGDLGLIPGLGRAPGEGKGYPHSGLEIPWTEEPGRLQVHGVSKSQTWLSGFHFHFQLGNGFIRTLLRHVLSEVTYVAVVNSWVCWVKDGLGHVWWGWWLSTGPPFPCSFSSLRRTACNFSHENRTPKWWEEDPRFVSFTSSFQQHTVGQNKSKAQPRFKRWRNGQFLLGGVVKWSLLVYHTWVSWTTESFFRKTVRGVTSNYS